MAGILIVEDDTDLRELIGSILIDEGFAIEMAATRGQALEALAQGSFDLILSDLSVGPDGDLLDGIAALAQAAPDTPLLVNTGYSEAQDYPLKELGVAGLILKPFELDHLVATVRAHLPPC